MEENFQYVQYAILVAAGFIIYFAARCFGPLVTLFYWLTIIITSFIYGIYTDNGILMIFSALSILFAIDDWKNFDKY